MNKMATEDHDWMKRDQDEYKFCRKCLTVKRADGKNKPCKGVVKMRPFEPILLKPNQKG